MEFLEEPFMGGLPDKTEANCEGYDAKRYHLLDGILSKRGEFRKRNPPHLYINLSISKVIHIYIIYIVVFYSYLLKLTEWLMLVISGIEFTTCFKNMPMQRTIPENITAAKAIVKIVIIIINLFKIYYLLFLKYECKVNTFLSNNGIFCREISLQYVFLDMGQPLVFSLENDILLSNILFLWQ